MKKIILLGIICILYMGVLAQPTLEDAQGTTTIFLNFKPTFSLNTGNGEVDFHYTKFKTTSDLFWGVKLGAIPNVGILDFFRRDIVDNGINGSAYLGFKELFTRKGSNIDWLVLRGAVDRKSQTLFDPERPWENQIHDTITSDFEAWLNYNLLANGGTLLGLSVGVTYGNNFNTLPTATISTPQMIVDSLSGAVRSINSNEQSVAIGQLASQWTIRFGPEFLHFFDWNNSLLALHVYARNDLSGGIYNLRPGVNVYLLESRNETDLVNHKVLFGINLEYNDLLNQISKESSVWGHLRSSITLGFSL